MEPLQEIDNPLTTEPTVSIIVITYNSSKYVTETLESAKAQTYLNIELIISDDCSTDNTVEISEKWINENHSRFIKAQLIRAEKNTGIPANCNRGVKASSGKWIKIIAGDDILLENCIADNIQYILQNSYALVVLSKVQSFKDSYQEKNIIAILPPSIPDFFSIQITSHEQYKMLLIEDRIINTPSAFYSLEVIKSVGFFDERFKFIEDYPMWLKLTKNGIKLHFNNKITVAYRQHSESVFNYLTHELFKPSVYRNEELRKIYVYPYLSFYDRLNAKYSFFICLLFRKFHMNSKTKINIFIYKILAFYMNPFFHLLRIKARTTK